MAITLNSFTTNLNTSSTNVVTGDGAFDDIMESVNAHINAQYKLGRITGPDYATVYLGAMQTAMQTALKFVLDAPIADQEILNKKAQATLTGVQAALTNAQTTLTDAQVATEAKKALDTVAATTLKVAQKPLIDNQAATELKKALDIVAATLLKGEQGILVVRQTKGFDDDAKQKLLKQVLDSWSVAYSVAQTANGIPDTIKADTIDQITKNAMDALGIIPATPTTTADGTVLDLNPLGVVDPVVV